ncbi:MAG: (d)CMP kinase [Muribaculaceae bacterium]|nr:(d)CMP kinase [Muribaculaceae bacterium]
MNNDHKIIVAIDGLSGSGKSTMARRLASQVGYRYIDSGAMFRAVTLFGLDSGCFTSPDDDPSALIESVGTLDINFEPQPDGTQHTMLNGRDVEAEIRQMRVNSMVSPVATIPEVRRRLAQIQQQLGKERGIVMDGRDIGTTVFPDAELKIYVDTPAEVRARRRYDEMIGAGADVSFEQILDNLVSRDKIDMSRAESPLRKAEDAVVLDNSDMTLEQQDAWILRQFQKAIERS